MNTETESKKGDCIVMTPDITVELVQYMGGDGMIAAAARVSTLGHHYKDGVYSPEPEQVAGNAGLIRYLMMNRHGSPFEHGSMTFRVHAPIFVFREWHRHRVGWSYNEESARYRQLDPVFWMPREDRKLVPVPGSTSARPEFMAGDAVTVAFTRERLKDCYTSSYDGYIEMLRQGVAREVARSCLPVGIFSSMYATCNPRSLMHFLSLRTHEPAAKFVSRPQAEIEEAARQMERAFAMSWPLTHAAFMAAGRVAP